MTTKREIATIRHLHEKRIETALIAWCKAQIKPLKNAISKKDSWSEGYKRAMEDTILTIKHY